MAIGVMGWASTFGRLLTAIAAVQDEPWLHALLLGMMRRRGYGVLANTSFNSRGHPILNSAKTALELLDSTPELDKVLIEDWLFSKS